MSRWVLKLYNFWSFVVWWQEDMNGKEGIEETESKSEEVKVENEM